MAGEKSARELALLVLLQVEKKEAFSHVAIRRCLEENRQLPRQERAFFKRLTEGTIEEMIRLDYIINQFSKTKTNHMKPVIRALLRSGVYQLLYMERVPASAVVNETVRLAKKKGFSSLRGFVNGVLRTVERQKDAIVFPSEEENLPYALSIQYAMPQWIVERFLAAYGTERTKRILAAFPAKTKTTLRVDTSRCSREDILQSLEEQGISATPHEGLPYAIVLDSSQGLEEIPQFREGLLYAQDVSSMLVAEYAAPKGDEFVLDVCAAPGGKSTHMAQLLQNGGRVEARDLTKAKVALILENAARCRTKNLTAKQWDARVFDPSMEEKADIVLADLPCSGLGVMGSKTDIKYNASEEGIMQLSALQREILETVWRYVRPGGTLVYSTCTITKEENEENTAWFLQTHPDFSLVFARQLLPDEGCDGFYIAKMERSL